MKLWLSWGISVRFSAGVAACGMLAVVSAQTPPDQLLLKDFRPHSIFKIPETRVEKARYPVIDMHSHNYAPADAEVERWVRAMDIAGVEKTVILSGNTGAKFDAVLAKYRKYPKRFEVWCGFDYASFEQPGFGAAAVAELERCHAAGATGVGELSDKGRGLGATSNSFGMHIDDPRLDPLLEKCAALHMPINIHVGEDKWMYEPMDAGNDGLMNAWKWRVSKEPGVLQHDEVLDTLERALKRHPQTVFIACHFANCCSDLNRLGAMLEHYPNLHADIGARFAEISPIPRFAGLFFERYQDRLLYGTDLNPEVEMYRTTFRLLETADEHFYTPYFSKYHWPLHALALPDPVLRKVYRENAMKILAGAEK
jgi:predicted TIM-barrel fold metal-dependent hydrolase